MRPIRPAVPTVLRRPVAEPAWAGWLLVVGVAVLLWRTWEIGYQRVVVQQHPTQLLDWLISYDGGFVRRGLSGSVLAVVSDATGVGLPVLAFLVQAALYGLFAIAMLALVRGVRLTWALALPLAAPFLFSFPVLAANAGYRKDVLALALVAAACAVGVSVRTDRQRFAVLLTAVGMFVPLVLVHEFLVVMLPYLVPLALRVEWSPDQRRALTMVLGAVAAAFVASVLAAGAPGHVAAICEALRDRQVDVGGPGHCGSAGSLFWLGAEAREGTDLVRQSLGRLGPGLAAVVPLTVAGLAPAAMETARLVAPRERRAVALAVTAAVVATLPVFVVAVDWGRLVYVHAAGTTVLLLTLRHGRPAPPAPWRWPGLVLLPYALLWTLGPNGRLFRGGWWEHLT